MKVHLAYRQIARAMGGDYEEHHDKCIQGKLFGVNLLQWYRNILDSLRPTKVPFYSYVWTTQWAHREINTIQRANKPYLDLFRHMKRTGMYARYEAVEIFFKNIIRSAFFYCTMGYQ